MKAGTSGILSRQTFIQRTRNTVSMLKDGSILEVGCGSWPLISVLKNSVDYCGLDLEAKAVERAKKDFPDYLFYVGNVESDNFNIKDRKKFDNIVMLAVMEHLNDPKNAIVKLKRYLNKNGQILLTTPTALANVILKCGSKFGLFDRSAEEDHHILLNKNDFISIADKAKLKLKLYKKFSLGLNQLVIFENSYDT